MFLYRGTIKSRGKVTDINTMNASNNIGVKEYTVFCPALSNKDIGCEVLVYGKHSPNYVIGEAVYVTELEQFLWVIVGKQYSGEIYDTEEKLFLELELAQKQIKALKWQVSELRKMLVNHMKEGL
jgi:hypothetical protein